MNLNPLNFLKSVLTIVLSISIALFWRFSEHYFVDMTCIVALSLLLTELIFGRFKNKL